MPTRCFNCRLADFKKLACGLHHPFPNRQHDYSIQYILLIPSQQNSLGRLSFVQGCPQSFQFSVEGICIQIPANLHRSDDVFVPLDHKVTLRILGLEILDFFK